MTTKKFPEPGEWWVSYCGAIAYICGFDPDGDPVFLTDRKENAHVDTMSGFLENWHHEPLCTGFDWKPPSEWPKYVICDTWIIDAYIRRDSETVASGNCECNGKPAPEPYCECHERDGSYVCEYCRSQGLRGHMEKNT